MLSIHSVYKASGHWKHVCTVTQDVGTVDSGLNSMVLASNNEVVLLPVNEPTFGTRRKSQIQVCSFFCAPSGPLRLLCSPVLCLLVNRYSCSFFLEVLLELVP